VAVKIFVITFSVALCSVNHVQSREKHSLSWKNDIKSKKHEQQRKANVIGCHYFCNIASLCVIAS